MRGCSAGAAASRNASCDPGAGSRPVSARNAIRASRTAASASRNAPSLSLASAVASSSSARETWPARAWRVTSRVSAAVLAVRVRPAARAASAAAQVHTRHEPQRRWPDGGPQSAPQDVGLQHRRDHAARGDWPGQPHRDAYFQFGFTEATVLGETIGGVAQSEHWGRLASAHWRRAVAHRSLHAALECPQFGVQRGRSLESLAQRTGVRRGDTARTASAAKMNRISTEFPSASPLCGRVWRPHANGSFPDHDKVLQKGGSLVRRAQALKSGTQRCGQSSSPCTSNSAPQIEENERGAAHHDDVHRCPAGRGDVGLRFRLTLPTWEGRRRRLRSF